MGIDPIVVNLADYHHRVASTASRAARPAIFSAVSPSDCAGAVIKIDFHHSAGIRSRCSHLRTAGALAPISAAIASGEGQSPMTDRNEVAFDIESSLGHIVLNGKANLSHDCGLAVDENGLMADKLSETEQKHAFISRVRLAREARYPTQKPILIILDIDQGLYKQYESRTPLPHRFIPKFCAATGVEIDWLLTGEGKGPVATEIAKIIPRRRRGRKTKVA